MNQNPPQGLVKEMQASRERLRQIKPKVYAKLLSYLEKESTGKIKAFSLLDWAYSFQCNFKCPHCCAEAFREKNQLQVPPSLEQVRHIADQAHALGIFIINFIGGEPLAWPHLSEIIQTIDPTRFHISLTTNGWCLDKAMADRLAKAGVDKIGVSLDSAVAEEHDGFRRMPGSFVRALAGIKFAKEAGIRTMISTVVTHQNIRSPNFARLLALSTELGVNLDLQCATVAGGWRGNYDALIDTEDAAYLTSLREKYHLLRRDVWDVPGSKGGCPAATRSVYIIPSGDVLPCLFMHITFGNIFKDDLEQIVDRMLQVKELRENSNLCLAGEDLEFIRNHLSKTFDAPVLPIDYRQVFPS